MSIYSKPTADEHEKTLSPSDDLIRRIGSDLLGPIVHRWLLGLHQYMNYLDDGNTAFLYCARAGVRIAKLYEIFAGGFPGGGKVNADIFWISRLSVAKGVFAREPKRAVELISRQYHHHSIRELIEGVLRHHPEILAKMNLSGEDMKAYGCNFPGWIEVKGPTQSVLLAHLEECGEAFDAYLHNLTATKSRVALIDSGWQGTTQSLLARGYPGRDWKGLYFGRILTPDHDPAIVDDAIGIMFERDTFDAKIPESALVRHRHIIEQLLEPNGPSIEVIPALGFLEMAEKLITENANEVVDLEKDRLYLHARQYLVAHAGASISSIIASHEKAMPELARMITMPTREEALVLGGKDRSADFGKSLIVPVFRIPDGAAPQERDRRIRDSLWPEGQVALECDGAIARDLQLRISGLTDSVAYFGPRAGKGADAQPIALPDPVRPKVAVITRTKNRPLLLKRAAQSLASQTFPDYQWVVVNDGGDEDVVREVIDRSTVDRQRIRLVSNEQSLGMEAASNAGIRACQSEYIVIHDDDDSWAPQFLEKAIAWLESGAGRRYGGVITKTLYVSEEIRGDAVIEHGRAPYQDWVQNVQMAEMAVGNLFAPIAFVFRRCVWEKIGGFNEDLPVLGDWFFNLEFLLQADIGVLPEVLAHYHHRDRGDSKNSVYANSVIGGISKHDEFNAIVRNEFLRRHGSKSSAAIAMMLGYMSSDLRQRLAQIGGGSVVPTAATAGSGVSASNSTELYWVCAHINRYLADRWWKRFLKFGRWPKPVRPTGGWTEVLPVLRQLRIAIPSSPDFDENAYLIQNPDVAKSVRDGKQRSGYMHYLLHGRTEGRIRS